MTETSPGDAQRTVVPDFGREEPKGGASDLIAFLEAVNAYPEVQAYKPRILEALALEEGMSVLDGGCGTGYDALRFKAAAGVTGEVVAIDRRPEMVEHTREKAHDAGLSIDAREGDISGLVFTSGRFDRGFCERVLIHLRDPALAVMEMGRTLKPGGRLVIVEPDLTSLTFASEDEDLTREIVLAQAAEFQSGSAGKHLGRYLVQAGMQDVRVEAIALNHSFLTATALDLETINTLTRRDEFPIPADRVLPWLEEQRENAEAGIFLSSTMTYMAVATKP